MKALFVGVSLFAVMSATQAGNVSVGCSQGQFLVVVEVGRNQSCIETRALTRSGASVGSQISRPFSVNDPIPLSPGEQATINVLLECTRRNGRQVPPSSAFADTGNGCSSGGLVQAPQTQGGVVSGGSGGGGAGLSLAEREVIACNQDPFGTACFNLRAENERLRQ